MLSFVQCSEQKRNVEPGSGSRVNEKAESFDEFYRRFHTDSLFQLERVVFPLPGFNSELHYSNPGKDSVYMLDGEPVNGHWSSADWVMHRQPTIDPDMKMDITRSDSVAIERTYIPGTEFSMKRIFKRLNSAWYLVYYKD